MNIILFPVNIWKQSENCTSIFEDPTKILEWDCDSNHMNPFTPYSDL